MATIFAIILALFIIDIYGKISNTSKLLQDLSDDINDIKRKLGLHADNRTQRQLDDSNIRYIREEADKGKTLEEFKKQWSYWNFRHYRQHIKYWTDNYNKAHPKNTICPKCQKYDNENEDGVCVDCDVKVVSPKEFNENK